MKNKLRLFFAFVLVIISGFLLFKSNNIVAFAKSLFILDYSYDEIYTKDDVFTISNRSDLQNIFLVYLDKNGELLRLLSSGYEITSGFHLESFSLGDTCEDMLSKYLVDDFCTNQYQGFINYDVAAEKIENIENWRVIDNNEKNVYYYCTTYDIQLPLCNGVVEDVELGYTSYLNDAPLFIFQEYLYPEFGMECDDDEIVFGEEVACRINVQGSFEYFEINVQLDDDIFDVKSINIFDGWEYEKQDDGNYIFINNDDFLGNGNIMEFSISPKKNEFVSDSSKVINLNVVTESGYNDEISLSSNMSILFKDEKEENPNTYDKRILVIFAIALFSIPLVMVLYKKKRFLE